MYKFIKSSTNNENWLTGHKKEVCFIGRSNVGKSSLINALVNQKKLARTSNTPGRTQLINFFQEDKKTLVDLPGYGYAKMPLRVKEEMLKMIEEYFEHREELIRTFVLIDSKIGPTNDDIMMLEYLKKIGRDVLIVMTKADKANQSETSKTLKSVAPLGDDTLMVSAHKGKNIAKLKKIIDSILR